MHFRGFLCRSIAVEFRDLLAFPGLGLGLGARGASLSPTPGTRISSIAIDGKKRGGVNFLQVLFTRDGRRLNVKKEKRPAARRRRVSPNIGKNQCFFIVGVCVCVVCVVS